MQTTSLYCSVCKVHTAHTILPTQYATACLTCGSHTNQLMRLQAEASAQSDLTAPDGTNAQIVDNTPTSITFYVPSGEHKGYYEYDKDTKKKTIRS